MRLPGYFARVRFWRSIRWCDKFKVHSTRLQNGWSHVTPSRSRSRRSAKAVKATGLTTSAECVFEEQKVFFFYYKTPSYPPQIARAVPCSWLLILTNITFYSHTDIKRGMLYRGRMCARIIPLIPLLFFALRRESFSVYYYGLFLSFNIAYRATILATQLCNNHFLKVILSNQITAVSYADTTIPFGLLKEWTQQTQLQPHLMRTTLPMCHCLNQFSSRGSVRVTGFKMTSCYTTRAVFMTVPSKSQMKWLMNQRFAF